MQVYKVLIAALLVTGSSISQAAIYKCPAPDGSTQFSSQPCNGAAASPENEIQVKTYEIGSQFATDEQIKEQEQRRAAKPAKTVRYDSGDSQAKYSENRSPDGNKPVVVFTSGDEKK